MTGSRFFKPSSSFTLQELADLTSSEIASGADPEYVLENVAPLNMATDKDLSFLDNIKYKEDFAKTKAGACFVSSKVADLAPQGVNLLISNEPYKAYALAAQKFHPEEKPESSISEAAYIDPSSKIGAGCTIEPGVVVRENAEVGDNCWIEANSVIGKNVVIGANCRIGANSTISHAVIGDYVRLYPGVCVGQDGFGFAIDPKGHVKVPQLGSVIIESHVEIGANTTIDRGAGPDTVIGQGTWIDNLVQIGHNVRIGRGCVIVAQVGIAGSSVIEDFVAIGGQAGIAGHLTIGTGAKLAARSGAMRDIPPGEEQIGNPSMPGKQFMRQIAALNRLTKK